MNVPQVTAVPRRVAIVGASGYTGGELLRLLLGHRMVSVEHVFALTSAGRRVDAIFPRFAHVTPLSFEPYTADAACTSEVVFVSLPSGESMRVVPELLERNKKVIDLAGDFRLTDAAVYEQFYRRPHAATGLLGTAVYGLPEIKRDQIREARFVTNPGCYPTSILLPLIPLVKEGIVEHRNIGITSLSGVSGAGRSSSVEMSFAEVNESVRAYKVGVHQHTPEIRQILQEATGHEVSFTFVPHLLPLTRGISTTIIAPVADRVTEDEIRSVYEKWYGSEPFVRVSPASVPEIKNVVNTNYIDIGFHLNTGDRTITVLSTIDNLVKGAAGQAVQNMNLMLGFPESEGLQ